MRLRRFTLTAAATLVILVTAPLGAHPGSGIVATPGGRVYFTDTGRGVWALDDNGKLTLVSRSAMHFMAADHAGRFADAPETFGEWFGRLTPKGQKPVLISCSDFPCAVGPDGNLYFPRMHSLHIVRRTPNGEESTVARPGDFKVDPTRPIGVNGIACGQDGTIYVVALDSLNRNEGTGEHVLYAVARDGSIRPIARDFVKDLLPADQRHPEVRPQYCRGMAVDARNNVYVAVTGNRCVMRISPQGKAETILRCQKPWTPTGVDVLDGSVYVLEYDDETPAEGRDWPPRVRKLSPDGKVSILATVTRGAGKPRDETP